MPNRLAASSSPYLQQHADNPVDWWEWSDEAFMEARNRDVPVFLSIGYAACHWCHVMAHESFEDAELAEWINANFVSIKVDREERPDIDGLYMQATLAMTGHGGWPMSVFLNHERKPFHAGTYFPPAPRHSMPSFRQLLEAIIDAWQQRREALNEHATQLSSAIADRALFVIPERAAEEHVFSQVVSAAASEFDELSGGFGGAPKFPPSPLLRAAFLTRDFDESGQLLAMAETTLERMARGGIYDQLGGGFARYSVDAEWVVPHFEKMLYDNAQLLEVYALWAMTSSSPLAARITSETADFMLREFLTAEGAFASSIDADSEGVEGKFYAWSQEQLAEVLGDDAAEAAWLFSVTTDGTFEHGLSTLQLLIDSEDESQYQQWREKLFRAREQRVRPGLDAKVVTSWNGLAIAALVKAGIALDRNELVEAATRAADYLLKHHVGSDGRVIRSSLGGRNGNSSGVLDDYSHLAYGLITLYQVTGEERYLEATRRLLDVVVSDFADADGSFFDTPSDTTDLFARLKQPQDGAEPSGWLMTAEVMLQYGALVGDHSWITRAEQALKVVSPLARHPRVVGTGIASLARLLGPTHEVALVGSADEVREIRNALVRLVHPSLVFACGVNSTMPLLANRNQVDSKATAYVCQNFACQLPVTSVDEMLASIRTSSK